MSSIARERIEKLLSTALERAREGKESGRLVSLALEIGERKNVSVPSKFRRKICFSCKSMLLSGNNVKIRLNPVKRNMVYTCQDCGEVERYGY